VIFRFIIHRSSVFLRLSDLVFFFMSELNVINWTIICNCNWNCRDLFWFSAIV